MYRKREEDIFDILNSLFPNKKNETSNHINYRNSERVIDEEEDTIHYTLQLIKVQDKGDISINVGEKEINIEIQDSLIPDESDTITLSSPRNLIPKKYDFTFVNNLLDITVYIKEEGEEGNNEEKEEEGRTNRRRE